MDDDLALEVGVIRIAVVVVAAGPDRIEVAGLLSLPGADEADVVDLGAVGVLRVRIRGHFPRSGVIIGKEHPSALRHGELLGADTGGRDRDGDARIATPRGIRAGPGGSGAPSAARRPQARRQATDTELGPSIHRSSSTRILDRHGVGKSDALPAIVNAYVKSKGFGWNSMKFSCLEWSGHCI